MSRGLQQEWALALALPRAPCCPPHRERYHMNQSECSLYLSWDVEGGIVLTLDLPRADP